MSNVTSFKSVSSALYPTRNSLSAEIKLATIAVLNQLVSDLIDLGLMTKQAHWNIRGKQFIAVHEMLDEFRTSLLEHQDEFAERVVQLGGVALGTLQDVAQHSRLTGYPTDIRTIEAHLQVLAENYARVANALRDAITVVEDENSVDMLTAASRDLDKFLWFIEAHLE